VASIQVGDIIETTDGLYAASIWPTSVATLSYAPDPSAGHIVIEGYLAVGSDWTQVQLPFPTATGDEQRQLAVRRLSLDLLLSPAEFAAVTPRLEGTKLAGIDFWQTYREPIPQYASLDGKQGRARRDAFVGLDICIAATLPHDGEAAVLTAPSAARVQSALDRILTASQRSMG
jgi:hypothetical protein